MGGGDFHFLQWALVQAKKGVEWTLIASSALWQAEQTLILYACCWQRPLPWAAEPPTRRGPRSHQHDGSQHHGCPSGRPSVSPTSARDFRGCLGTAWGSLKDDGIFLCCGGGVSGPGSGGPSEGTARLASSRGIRTPGSSSAVPRGETKGVVGGPFAGGTHSLAALSTTDVTFF